MSRRLDLIGQKFGKLLVINLHSIKVYGKSKHSVWKCNCDCGRIAVVAGYKLKNGHTKSCGCLVKNKNLNDLDAIYNYLFNVYIKGSISRNMEFCLSIDEFKYLIHNPCYYCEDSNSNVVNRRKLTIRYNGIDRVDNNLGYTKNNSVSCCKYCNLMKSNLSIDKFKNQIKKIYRKVCG